MVFRPVLLQAVPDQRACLTPGVVLRLGYQDRLGARHIEVP